MCSSDLDLAASSTSPSAGDEFAAEVAVQPLEETFDAYGVVLGEGEAWSFDLANPGALVSGVRPLVRSVPGLTDAWEGTLFRIDSIPEYLRGRTFTFIAGLVPEGKAPAVENAIPGFVEQEEVEVR